MPNAKIKRLFFDLETSPNIGFFWQPGNKISISYENIIQERAIICACYKWEGDKEVKSLSWNKGDDKNLLIALTKVMHEADEIIAHNGDNFDIKWFRTRCIYHRILTFPKFTTVDTLKLSRKGFRFNSNKLDYIGKFLGVGGKIETSYNLWKDIVLLNSKTAMDKMVTYCKMDVKRLEQIYSILSPYTEHKTHVGVLNGKSKCSCPKCASTNIKANGTRITAAGLRKKELQCNSCGGYFRVSETEYLKSIK